MKVIFCIPGSGFTGRFLDSWTRLIRYCHRNNIEYLVSHNQNAVVYYVRNMCLGGDILRGKKQLPFNGESDYTHLMWIDSDMVFEPEHFQQLLDRKLPIVSGVYKDASKITNTTVEKWDDEYFLEKGHYKFMTDKDLESKEDVFTAAYTGFGFMLIEAGVFEALEYPWFAPVEFELEGIKDFLSEDASFCKRIAEIGYKIHIDKTVRVGHEKTRILV